MLMIFPLLLFGNFLTYPSNLGQSPTQNRGIKNDTYKATGEFKREAVKSDETYKVISDNLGINYKTLTYWIRASMASNTDKDRGGRLMENLLLSTSFIRGITLPCVVYDFRCM